MTDSPSPATHGLVSISIDVCGSTAAKQQIHEFQCAFGRHVEQFEAYLRTFCRIEHDFYSALSRAHVASLRSLFVVKHIGDEIWCVLPVCLEEIERTRSTVHDVLIALLDVLTRHRDTQFTITDTPDEPWREDWEDDEWTSIDLGVKATVDLLRDVHDFTDFRFRNLAARLLASEEVAGSDAERESTLQSLNFGTTSITDARLRSVVRSDYVGLDVDRFFRLTQRAMPGLLLVGDDLCDYINPTISRATEGHFEHVSYMVAHEGRAFFDEHPRAPASGGKGCFWRSLVREEHKFKGLAKNYGFRYLLGAYNTTLPHQSFISGYDGLYAETASRLRQAGIMGPPHSLDDMAE